MKILNFFLFLTLFTLNISLSFANDNSENNSKNKFKVLQYNVEPVRWEKELKELIYDKNEVILDGRKIMELTTPYRAQDAAIVPISLKFNKIQNDKEYVESIIFVVDENPSPIVGKFFMTTKTGNPDIATRVRIDKYTYVRAIAEMNNGKKYMVANFVKAAGGCSAPSLADMDSVMARLGKMKMKLIKTGEVGNVNKAQFIISHPNFSGLQFSQLTRTEIPAHFVNQVKIIQDGESILEVESDISISEDPSFTFYYLNTGGPISVEVTDSDGQKFSKEWPVNKLILNSKL